MRPVPLLAVPPIVALGLLGCGGGDDGPTKDDFISKADEICKDVRAEGEAIDKSDPKTPQELVQYADRADKFIAGGLERIKDIELPKDSADREGAQAYVDQLEKSGNGVEQLKTDAGELQQAVEANDKAQVQSVGEQLKQTAQEVKDAGNEADKLATDYGMKECGKD
jgi:hypothetical protein